MTETKWLTVKEASLLCYEMGLPRSAKSIRRWCQFDNIEAQKRQVANTEKWFIDRESLEIKIKEELEFVSQSEKPMISQPDVARQGSDISGHDRTQADLGAYNQTQADMSGHGYRQRPDASGAGDIRDLEDQILILKTDLKWRDKVISDQKQANEILLDEVKGQSRYIGHLETKLERLGVNTNQAFLKAPIPKSERSEDASQHVEAINSDIVENRQTHPDQADLYSG